MEPNLCIYNKPLRHKKKGKERKLKSKIRYHDMSCYRMMQNNATWQQTCKNNDLISWNYLGWLDIIYQQKSRMNKDQNLLVMS